jgi:hypothetical protein
MTQDGMHRSVGTSAESWRGKLRKYGLAGVVAYGLLNTLYYFVVFLVVWSSFKVPRGISHVSLVLCCCVCPAAGLAAPACD